MKLKTLATINDYRDFYAPVLSLDIKSGEGCWREGADIIACREVIFGQEFQMGQLVCWEEEESKFARDFTFHPTQINTLKQGEFRVKVSLFLKGKTGSIVQAELLKNKQATGLKTIGQINTQGKLHLNLSGIQQTEKEACFQIKIKSESQARLICGASFFLLQKLKE